MTEAISKRKKQDVNATYNGPSFTEILSRQKSIDELIADRTEETVVSGGIRFTKHADARLMHISGYMYHKLVPCRIYSGSNFWKLN